MDTADSGAQERRTPYLDRKSVEGIGKQKAPQIRFRIGLRITLKKRYTISFQIDGDRQFDIRTITTISFHCLVVRGRRTKKK
jgi:hypothetical protein